MNKHYITKVLLSTDLFFLSDVPIPEIFSTFFTHQQLLIGVFVDLTIAAYPVR
jgi:hypothetical protein